MMIPKILFLDCDGLLFHTLDAHILFINAHWGIQSKPGDYLGNPSIHTVVNKYLVVQQRPKVTDAEAYRDLTEHFHVSKLHHNDVQPVEGMVQVLPRLAEKYELVMVTARPRQAQKVIKHLLQTHSADYISHIHFVYDHLGKGIFDEVSKREFIAGYEGDKVAFIDDTPSEILKLQDIVPSYLFDPLHLHARVTDVTNRVHSWAEIGQVFL